MKRRLSTLLPTILLFQLSFSQSLAWVKGIGGANQDYGTSLAVGGSGNVYVSGYFVGPVDFDPNAGTAILPSGGTGFLQKLTPAGNFVWAKQMGVFNSGNLHHGIAVDANENIYLTGTFGSLSNDFDPGPGVYSIACGGGSGYCSFVAKYDSAGNFLWAKAFVADSGNAGSVQSLDIALDASGNVFTGGVFSGAVDFDPGPGTFPLVEPSGFGDAFICKLDPLGNLLWAQGKGTSDDEAGYSIAVDGAGNVTIVGSSHGGIGIGVYGGIDIFLVKYNSTGLQQWEISMGGTGDDLGLDLAASPAGNLYLTGRFDGTADFDPSFGTYNLSAVGPFDAFVLKLDSSGNLVWAKDFGGTNSAAGNAIAVDPLGNVHTIGVFSGTADFDPGAGTFNLTAPFSQERFISDLDAMGNFVNAGHFGGQPYTDEEAIAVTLTGEVYTTGAYTGTKDFDPWASVVNLTANGNHDIFVQKIGACTTPPAPANTTSPSNLTICAGETTVLSAIGSGTLTWYAMPSGGVPLSTGGSFTTPALPSTTTYYVESTTCFASPRTAITVTTIPATAASITATACYSYLSPSGNQTWTSSGTYMDTLVNTADCDSVITINLTISNTTSSTISPTACDTYTSPSGNHVWTSSGTYIDTIPNLAGCDSIITINLTITTVDVTVTNNSPTLVSNATSASYQWIYCDSATISGATNASFTATANGNYAVIVTQNSCSDTSTCFAVTNVLALENDFGSGFRVHPNPTTGRVYMEFGVDHADLTVHVWNAFGQIITPEKITTADGLLLDLSGSSGIYFVEVRKGAGASAYFKVIKR